MQNESLIDCKSVSDIVGDDYKNWQSGDKILISTPTGSGKTSFILEKLVPFAAQEGKRVVYLCNRSALLKQVKNRFEKLCLSSEDGSNLADSLTILTYQSSEFIGLASAVNAQNESSGEIGFVVFDEAHYFLHDAAFNARIDYWRSFFPREGPLSSIDRIKKKSSGEIYLPNLVCIFLTATPDEFLLYYNAFVLSSVETISDTYYTSLHKKLIKKPKEVPTLHWGGQKRNAITFPALTVPQNFKLLSQEETALFGKSEDSISTFDTETQKELCKKAFNYFSSIDEFKELYELFQSLISADSFRVFGTEKCYDNFCVRYFKREPGCENGTRFEAIIPLITSKNSGRWLIFVNNKVVGKSLCQKLNFISNKKGFAEFIDTNSKSKKAGTFSDISKNNSFKCSVLITTSVLDNGINICDNNVNNIVLSTIDKTAFIQMLGRKRIDDGSKINLYIMHHDMREFQYNLRHNIQTLQLVKYFENMRNIKEDVGYACSLASDKDCASHNLDNGKSGLNMDLYHKIELLNTPQQTQYYERLLLSASINPSSGFHQLFAISPTNLTALYGGDVDKSREQIKFLRNYDLKETSYIKLLYDTCNLSAAVHSIKSYDLESDILTIDKNAFLKTQLSWIGKEYDETAWIGYEGSDSAKAKLLKKLELQAQSGYFGSLENKDNFVSECFNMLYKGRLLSKSHETDMSRYRRDKKVPGICKLNNALEYAEIPYRIKLKQHWVKDKKITDWLVVLIEESAE